MSDTERAVDLRSDTVTRPTPAMYEAMMSAPVGDDVFSDDPTVLELQDEAARLFGKEEALFCPSGTMANQIAIRVHTQRGDEVICEATCHTYLFEQGGMAQLSGVQAHPIPGAAGVVDIDRMRAAVRPDNEHFTRTRLVTIENTHNSSGGAVLPLDYVRDVGEFCREKGLTLHLDGARIANAEAATGISLADWAAPVDSVTCCLSKGLAAPTGTLLIGTRDFIARARRVRKVFGGGMRQVGILAAAGLVALRDMRARLVDDHRRASDLARALNELDEVDIVAPATNLVYANLAFDAAPFADALESRDVLAISLGPRQIRFVTHADVDDESIARAVEVVRDVVPSMT